VFEASPQYWKSEGNNLNKLKTIAAQLGSDVVLQKVRGASPHGGGIQLTPDAPQYTLLKNFLAPASISAPAEPLSLVFEDFRSTYRRASLLLTGSVPTNYPPLQNEEALKNAIEKIFENKEFYDFVKRGANDRLLTRSINSTFSLDFYLNNYYPAYNAIVKDNGNNFDYIKSVSREIGESPLELISYVIKNNHPYTEILTADYTMVSQYTADIYQSNISPATGSFLPAKNNGQRISSDKNPLPSGNWNLAIAPNANPVGILSTLGFLQQYQTNATNHNRARARWTFQHFLGIDIENSSARNIDASVLTNAQAGSPTLLACKVCHDRIDPVAGAFQRYGNRGIYLEGAYGTDSLDASYKASRYYETGDTWYRSMLAPGFEGETFNTTSLTFIEDPLRTLANRLTKHPKFSEGAIKFWWPAIFGEEFLPYSLNDNELQLRQTWLDTLSKQFKESGYNFKFLLRDIVLSPFFRTQVSPNNIYRRSKRLLTPEELFNKTRSLTHYEDTRLLNDWLITYGGIDSYNVDQRQRTFTAMMYQIALRHALDTSCSVMEEINRSINNQVESQKNNYSLSAETPVSISVNGTANSHKLLLTNIQSSAVNIQLKFLPTHNAPIDFEKLTIAANSSWTSPFQNEMGEWAIVTEESAARTIDGTIIQFDNQEILRRINDLAFKFWGETSVESANELYNFYLNLQADHNTNSANLVSACISTNGLPDWIISELARWRLVYIRLMTDYDYLYE
jgi:hypothetical protein